MKRYAFIASKVYRERKKNDVIVWSCSGEKWLIIVKWLWQSSASVYLFICNRFSNDRNCYYSRRQSFVGIKFCLNKKKQVYCFFVNTKRNRTDLCNGYLQGEINTAAVCENIKLFYSLSFSSKDIFSFIIIEVINVKIKGYIR
jgi:hypothetical protein